MTSEQKRALLAWSCGKDSAYALWVLRQRPDVEVVGLLTTLNCSVDRVSMHGVHQSVLEAQARACRLPLMKVPLPDPCTDEAYRAAMADAMDEVRRQGAEAVAFGALFLADVRAYRKRQLAPMGISPLFPLWGRSTSWLAREMIDAGLEAIVTCVDTEQLDRSFVGRPYDRQLLEDLPAAVDPCAANGEFHTVAVTGPMFHERLDVRVGEVVERQRFVFADVALLAPSSSTGGDSKSYKTDSDSGGSNRRLRLPLLLPTVTRSSSRVSISESPFESAARVNTWLRTEITVEGVSRADVGLSLVNCAEMGLEVEAVAPVKTCAPAVMPVGKHKLGVRLCLGCELLKPLPRPVPGALVATPDKLTALTAALTLHQCPSLQ